ncbi:MAG TPA: c-type cytochrome biogenesis protein CcmI [Caulobacteraceae bacterium]
MLAFWIAAALLSAAAAALMLAMGARAGAAPAEDPGLAVHRRQLAEIDDLAERGLLAEDERGAMRAEAARRLLAADTTLPPRGGKGRVGGVAATLGGEVGLAPNEPSPQRTASTPTPGLSPLEGERRAVFAAAALTPLAALAIYLSVGHPGWADQPFAGRLAEWRGSDPATLNPPQMAAVLRMIAAERPRDPEPLKNLALAEMASDNYPAAVEALRKALALAPARADLWSMLGEVFVAQGKGEVGEDARAAFDEALRIDPRAQGARYFLGRSDIQAGRVAQGLAVWQTLLDELPAGDPRAQGLRAEIAQVKSAGGLKPAPIEQPAGMQAQIQKMVDGLAARLAAQPDDPQGWVRLVRAYTVLGDAEKRDAALARARGLYKDQPDILKGLNEAAEAPR